MEMDNGRDEYAPDAVDDGHNVAAPARPDPYIYRPDRLRGRLQRAARRWEGEPRRWRFPASDIPADEADRIPKQFRNKRYGDWWADQFEKAGKPRDMNDRQFEEAIKLIRLDPRDYTEGTEQRWREKGENLCKESGGVMQKVEGSKKQQEYQRCAGAKKPMLELLKDEGYMRPRWGYANYRKRQDGTIEARGKIEGGPRWSWARFNREAHDKVPKNAFAGEYKGFAKFKQNGGPGRVFIREAVNAHLPPPEPAAAQLDGDQQQAQPNDDQPQEQRNDDQPQAQPNDDQPQAPVESRPRYKFKRTFTVDQIEAVGRNIAADARAKGISVDELADASFRAEQAASAAPLPDSDEATQLANTWNLHRNSNLPKGALLKFLEQSIFGSHQLARLKELELGENFANGVFDE